MKLVQKLMIAFALASCSYEHTDFYVSLRADIDFESSEIEETEKIMKTIASKWKLHYSEHDRQQMAYLSEGQQAFHISLSYEQESILQLTNAGVSRHLNLTLVDHKSMPVTKLNELLNQVKTELEDTFDIRFENSAEHFHEIDQ